MVAQLFTVDTVIWDKALIAVRHGPNHASSTLPRTGNTGTSLIRAQVDCFHPSGEGQAYFGIGLWNNMLQPIGEKSTLISAKSEAGSIG